MIHRPIITLVVTVHLFLQVGIGEEIFRRDGLPVIEGTILSGGETGLLVKQESQNGSSIRIPWSTIKSIEPIETRPRLQQFMEQGDQLWRAKLRLIRGDVQLAELIFEEQFERLIGTDGEDTRLASEGLLRVLVAQGHRTQALRPWLETVRLQEIGFESPFSTLQPILDVQTMLCPHLPLINVETKDLQWLSEYKNAKNPIASSIAVVLSEDYDQSGEHLSVLHVQDPLFLSQLLRASKGETQDRAILETRLHEFKPWQQVWARYSLGLGCLKDNTKGERNRGLVHLAFVASQDPAIQPWLSGAAMIKLADELDADGQSKQATRILHEANRLFPTHPLLVEVNEKIRNSFP